MICSERLWAGRLLYNYLWIFFLLFTVSDGRSYDKCITKDGRQGVCVIKRFCREASRHELLSCERDDESHCCPITQRSAPTLPPPERPRQEDRYIPEPEVNRKRPEVFQEPGRDDRLNKTPPPGDRRPPPRHNGRPKEQPNRDGIDEYDSDRRSPYEPPERPRPPERPKKRPSNDNPDEYHDGRRGQDEPRGNPRDRPERPRTNPHSRPSVRPDIDRYYPAKDHLEPSSPPERIIHDKRQEVEMDQVESANPPRRNHDWVSEQKDRRTDDSSKFPIQFPNTDKLSVPTPKVPACGVKPYDLFIAGGQESAEHEWPWMTSIFRRYPDSRPKTFLCGGSLINTKYVLTAAHCFVNNYVILPASSFVVRLGSHFLDSGEEYTVSNLVIHHNHSGSDFFNDIALVRLASEVYITDKIAPICLPYPEMIRDDFVGKLATVAGWGDTAFRTSGTRILQHVTVPIVSGDECFAAYSRVRGAAFLARGSDHVICAGLREGGKDACLGDSGGPLMMKMPDDRWIIIGIVSLGYKCAEPGYPGVYTRVTHYMSWINTNMKRY